MKYVTQVLSNKIKVMTANFDARVLKRQQGDYQRSCNFSFLKGINLIELAELFMKEDS